MKKFWLTLVVLAVVHTAVCFAADRRLTKRYVTPPGTPPVETTTPEEQARGERVFVSVTSTTERPAALVHYAIGGYIVLLVVAVGGAFVSIRRRPHENAA